MKKISLLLILLVAAFTVSANAQQVERDMVVLEITTGTWCYYCPGAAMGAEDLIANGKDVAVVEYHSGDNYTNSFGSSRNSYYNVTGIPDAQFDGILNVPGGDHTTSLYPQYLNRYNQRKAIMSSFAIDVTGETSGFTDFFTEITIEKVASSTASNLKLHVVVTESEIEENWQGMTELNYVERLMAPNQYGTDMDFSDNDTQIVNIDFTIEDSWVYEHCELVVFLQDNSTKEILQGFKMPLTDFGPANDYDVAVTKLMNIPEGACSGSISPYITIRNNSEIELTDADINYSVNSGDLSTIQWTGNLGYLETVDIDIPTIDYVVQENNSFMAYTTNPNGMEDEFVNNDTIIQDFSMAMSVPQSVSLMIRMDDKPEEISWDLKNSVGDIIYSGDSYTVAGATIIETFELDEFECYSFTMYDTGGDGLEGSAFFILFYGSSSTILTGSDFGSVSTTEFTTGYVGLNDKIDTKEMSVFPNPFYDKTQISFSLNSTQKIRIDVYNIIGERVYSIERGNFASGKHVIELDRGKLKNGIYFIRMNIDGKSIIEKIIIN